MGDRVDLDLVEGDELVAEEPERPPRAALGWVAAGQRDQPGLGLAVDLSLIGPVGGFAVDRLDPPVGVSFAEVVGRGFVTPEGVGDCLVGVALVGLQQDSGPGNRLGGVFAGVDKSFELGALFGG